MSENVERRLSDVAAGFPRPDEQVTRHVERRVLALLPTIRVRSATALTVLALGAALSLGVVIGHWDASASPSGRAAAPAVRSVDVTLLCTAHDRGSGYREVAIGTAVRRKLPMHEIAGSVYVMDGVISGQVLVSATGEAPSGTGVGALYYHRIRCSRSSARIPLTRTGLSGGATVDYARLGCESTRRVLVRVRATLKSPGRWMTFGQKGELRGIRRNVAGATIAVATHPAKRPLAYATFDGAGKARLFTARTCS